MEFSFRKWKSEDLDYLVEIANNAKIADNLTNHFPHPYTKAAGEGFIEMTKTTEANILAIDLDGKAIGAIGLHPQPDLYEKNAELGYWLGEPYWGKGIMTEAIKRMTAIGFETTEINRIFARPFGSNIGSQKVLEKANYVLEAKMSKTIFKNGRYEDELIYAARRKDWNKQ